MQASQSTAVTIDHGASGEATAYSVEQSWSLTLSHIREPWIVDGMQDSKFQCQSSPASDATSTDACSSQTQRIVH
jgi:hypothetical protein